MGAIFVSILKNLIEVVLFAAVAWAGIMFGKNRAMKKAADKKDTK